MCHTNKIVGQETENMSDKMKEAFVNPESELPLLIMNMAIDEALMRTLIVEDNKRDCRCWMMKTFS